MSLLRGTIKNKVGLIRQFKELSLDQLDFTSKDEDFLLDDLDDIDEFPPEEKDSPENLKKRFREEDAAIPEDNVEICVVQKDKAAEQIPKADACITPDEAIEKLERLYTEERGLVVRSDGFISTPLHALKTLACKFNENIHNEINMIDIGEAKPLARVELFVGVFRGVGESFSYRLATQMAAIDILMRVEKMDLGSQVVPYAMFPGWRIRPRVVRDLMLLCSKNDLKLPRYHTKSNINEPEKPVCLVECYIGKKLVACGESDLSYVARKLAACNAIESLTGEKYPLEYVALGAGCLSYGELVEQNTIPKLSDKKIQWLLDDSSELSNEERGIDLEELAALQQSIYKTETEEIEENTKKVKITVSINSDAQPTRNVQVN